MVNYKKYIIECLTILKQNAIKEGGTFQARAYTKVINNINNIDEPIVIPIPIFFIVFEFLLISKTKFCIQPDKPTNINELADVVITEPI